jgi:phospholipase C
MGALQGIEHVVVLMLENRSFDSIFGTLYPPGAAFSGLTGKEVNPQHNADGSLRWQRVWNNRGMDPASACIPDPDPGELFLQDMNIQLFGLNGTPNSAPPPMSGFVDNYLRQPPGPTPIDPKAVMHFFTEKQVPVISSLAKSFGVSDQWYASAPCQTWPNRFFVHAATADGYVDNSHFHVPFQRTSIFRRLQDNKKTWRVYFHDLPQSATLGDIWLDIPAHFRDYNEHFARDVSVGDLPNYTFIEPRYFTDGVLGKIPNDAHPPHNVVYAEQLIANVYNAVRQAPTWKKTLLVITFDEHGGCYDHMPPPRAVPPDFAPPKDGFAFDRYGVRVPAVIVSPYMPPGEIVRVAPQGLPHEGPPYPFDHTSIIATLRKLFNLGQPLTARDAVAPDLLGPLSLENPDNDGPESVTPTPATPSPAEVAAHASAPPNDMQRSLCRMAAHLPPSAAVASAHLQSMTRSAPAPAGPVIINPAPFAPGGPRNKGNLVAGRGTNARIL